MRFFDPVFVMFAEIAHLYLLFMIMGQQHTWDSGVKPWPVLCEMQKPWE